MKKIVDDALFDVEVIKSPLEEKFGIPPFSIFDTMQGYWRNRVNEWKKLGIKSELGREDNLTFNIKSDIESSKKNKIWKIPVGRVWRKIRKKKRASDFYF